MFEHTIDPATCAPEVIPSPREDADFGLRFEILSYTFTVLHSKESGAYLLDEIHQVELGEWCRIELGYSWPSRRSQIRIGIFGKTVSPAAARGAAIEITEAVEVAEFIHTICQRYGIEVDLRY